MRFLPEQLARFYGGGPASEPKPASHACKTSPTAAPCFSILFFHSLFFFTFAFVLLHVFLELTKIFPEQVESKRMNDRTSKYLKNNSKEKKGRVLSFGMKTEDFSGERRYSENRKLKATKSPDEDTEA